VAVDAAIQVEVSLVLGLVGVVTEQVVFPNITQFKPSVTFYTVNNE
jgi:hypothetical protein